MPTYLDLLPDELYQKIITPLFTQCVEEVAHKCNLAYHFKRRSSVVLVASSTM